MFSGDLGVQIYYSAAASSQQEQDRRLYTASLEKFTCSRDILNVFVNAERFTALPGPLEFKKKKEKNESWALPRV